MALQETVGYQTSVCNIEAATPKTSGIILTCCSGIPYFSFLENSYLGAIFEAIKKSMFCFENGYSVLFYGCLFTCYFPGYIVAVYKHVYYAWGYSGNTREEKR